jgi:hypothetical protein
MHQSDRYESLSRSLPKLKFKYFEIFQFQRGMAARHWLKIKKIKKKPNKK